MTDNPNDTKQNDTKKGPRHVFSILGLCAVLALVAWEFSATLFQHREAAQPEHWTAAVAKLRKLRPANSREPILIAPLWAGPTAREYLSGLLDLPMATLPHVDDKQRIWQLSTRGGQHPWLSTLTPQSTWPFGPVTLSLFERPPVTVLYNFRDHLSDAVVRLVGEQTTLCKRRGSQHTCNPPAPDAEVRPFLGEIGYHFYRCIYAHPADDNRLLIAFHNVPLGAALVGFTGIYDFRSRRKIKTPVLIQTYVENELVASIQHQNDWPWMRFQADTARWASTHGNVRFEITTPDATKRTFCFHAETRR